MKAETMKPVSAKTQQRHQRLRVAEATSSNSWGKRWASSVEFPKRADS
jgi:hypothetical protein